MQTTPDTRSDLSIRQARRRTAPPIGAVTGAIAGLVVALLADVFLGSVTPVAYVGAALLGAVIGLVLAMLVPAAIDDGDDDDRARARRHHRARGHADAPVEGAHARDTR